MRGYSIKLSRQAEAYLQRLDRPTKERITEALRKLAVNPFSIDSSTKILAGREGQFRLRVGDYRIVYRVENNELIIFVITITPRGDV